jgi:hypothetical protein
MAMLFRASVATCTTALLLAPAVLAAQTPAPAAAPTTPVVSGTLFANYQYSLSGPTEDFNQFVVDRAYLTVRSAVAPRTSVRATAEAFQAADGTGWALRMKFAYLDYALNQGDWATTVRAGMLPTVAFEPQEKFWPRWLGPVAADRHGFISSADVGASLITTLPHGLGEAFAQVVNGTGYAKREVDRYKDVGGRLSLRPFASRDKGMLGSATFTAWVYDGATLGSLGALQRDRWGVHAGADSPRLTVAGDYSRRTDEGEDEFVAPGTQGFLTRTEGAVTSAFAIVRPFGVVTENRKPALGLVARYDHVDPSDLADDEYHYLIGGAMYAINARLGLSLNYQEQLGNPARAAFRGVFANVVLDF